MSQLLVTLFTAFILSTPLWKTDFNEAKAEAVQTHKIILLNFSGSDWCGPCIRLKKEIFGADVFQQYASKNLVLVNADFPRMKKNQLPAEQVKQNEALADRYNNSGKFPFTVAIDATGKVLKQWNGLPNETPEEFVTELKSLNNDSH